MNIIQQLEQEQAAKLAASRAVPSFRPGDTLRIKVKVVEGTRERVQAFEGVCIARRLAGVNSSFTVRKISYGEGVERVFPLYSPRIAEIEVVRRGQVARAKLYYLRGLTGKAARILERAADQPATAAEALAMDSGAAAAPLSAEDEARLVAERAAAKERKAKKKEVRPKKEKRRERTDKR